MSKLNLDVESPDKVSEVLRQAADAYYDASIELSSAWQDEKAGKIWAEIAGILEETANEIDKLVRRYFR